MKHEIPLMLRQGGGAIVNTSSGAGVKGFPGGASYVAAKHGVVGLSKSAAARLRGIEHHSYLDGGVSRSHPSGAR